MNLRLARLSQLLPLLREIEKALPPEESAPKDIGQDWIQAPFAPTSAKIFRHDGHARIENFDGLAHDLPNEGGILVIGIAELDEERVAIFLGTCPALETTLDFEVLVRPLDPRHGFIFVTAEDASDKAKAAFCWGSRDMNAEIDKRGYMDRTPTPLDLRSAFDLPERLPPDAEPPTRIFQASDLIRCCQAWIRELFRA